MAEVIATGPNTKFGRAAELLRTAHVTSTQQKAVLRVVLYLAGINGALAAFLIAYAWYIQLPLAEIIPLALIAILAFTLRGSIVGTRKDLAEAIEFADEGKVKAHIHQKSLEDINDVFADLKVGKVDGRIVMKL